MSFHIIEGITRVIDSLGNAITSTLVGSTKQSLDVNVANAPSVKTQDGVGNNLTSTIDGSSRSLDSHITNAVGAPVNTATVVGGAAIDPRAVPADVIVTGTITAAGQSVKITVAGYASRGIVVSGTWAGSLVCETSLDNEVTWSQITIRSGSLLAEQGIIIPQIFTAISANGSYKPNSSGGITHLRIRADSFALGSASISLLNSSAPHMFNFGQQAIVQSVIVLEQNSSVINLCGGEQFIGGAEYTLGVNSIQVSVRCSEDIQVNVQQSADAINWDTESIYTIERNVADSRTHQAVGTYVRVVVTNLTGQCSSFFRLSTILCPIVEALPRSLTEAGNLKVAINENFPVTTDGTEQKIYVMDINSNNLLEDILIQLKIMNTHFELLTENKVNEIDL